MASATNLAPILRMLTMACCVVPVLSHNIKTIDINVGPNLLRMADISAR